MFLNLFLILGLILLASAAYAGAQGAPWVPTWKRDLKRIERLVDIKPGESFVELGCGNGRVCRYLLKIQPEAQVVGIELSLLQYFVARMQNFFLRSNAKIIFQNAFQHNLSQYDVIYLFLMPAAYEKIRPKLEAELKPGSRVLTYVWPIKGWAESALDMAKGSPIFYLYRR